MKKGTVIRTTVLVLALLNQMLIVFGKNPLPFSDEELYQGVSAVLTVITSLISWWKNNSFTKKARLADEYLKHLKEEEKNGN